MYNVIISDEEIGSPITNTPRALIAMDVIASFLSEHAPTLEACSSPTPALSRIKNPVERSVRGGENRQ